LVAADTWASSFLSIVISRIVLGADQEPQIAVAASTSSFEPVCSDASIHVAEPMEGGGWQVEEEFFLANECTEYSTLGFTIDDLSLALASSGEKALGFIVTEHTIKSGWGSSYHIMIDHGAGWVDETICGGICQTLAGPPCIVDGRAQDIAYDQTGQLFSTFTRERLLGAPPHESVKQSISLARKTATGWEEETLWYNTLYEAEVVYSTPPHLLLSQDSKPSILYNTPGPSNYRIALLREWF